MTTERAMAATALAAREGFSLRTAYRRLKPVGRCRHCGLEFTRRSEASLHAVGHVIADPAEDLAYVRLRPVVPIEQQTEDELATSLALARHSVAEIERELEKRGNWRTTRPARIRVDAVTGGGGRLSGSELAVLGLVSGSPTSGLGQDWRLERRRGQLSPDPA